MAAHRPLRREGAIMQSKSMRKKLCLLAALTTSTCFLGLDCLQTVFAIIGQTFF